MTQEITNSARFGLDVIRTRLRSHEHILEGIDSETLKELGDMAKKGQTLPEMASKLQISFAEMVLARQKSEEFDELCRILETRAAGTHLEAARKGIRNPKAFSPAAYDRVMGALGFTPHVAHVQVEGIAKDDKAADKTSRARVGFDVPDFITKHEGNIIDITPESDDVEDIL